MQKANIYIDGFNFYNGLVDQNWKKYYWLDIVKFSKGILDTLQSKPQLANTYYFSAEPYKHITKEKRQRRFFNANLQNDQFNLVLGYHKDKSKICGNCKNNIAVSEEKQTDVNIALYMLGRAVKKECDLSILISGDTDMIPIIKAIKDIDPNHQVMIFFPPSRKTNQMIDYVNGWRDLSVPRFEKIFRNSLLKDSVEINTKDETKEYIVIPEKWKRYQNFPPLSEI